MILIQVNMLVVLGRYSGIKSEYGRNLIKIHALLHGFNVNLPGFFWLRHGVGTGMDSPTSRKINHG